MTSDTIQHWKQVLQRMREEDTNRRVFGSEQHQYALGPTLSEYELQAFEQARGIVLPADYRQFLAEVGNGGTRTSPEVFMGNSGAGPYYGLQTLTDAAQDCDLHLPFPFTESTEMLSEEEIDERRDPDLFPGLPGALGLCHGGSGIVYYLVVNGSDYGTMWEGREYMMPLRVSFEDWYGRWITGLAKRALPMLARERSVAEITVGMSRAEVIAICGGSWKLEHWESRERMAFLSFDGLATQFKIDDSEAVTRIIRHHIYC